MTENTEVAPFEKGGRLDGLLWRLARLHPAWVTVIAWLGVCSYLGSVALVDTAHPLATVVLLIGCLLIYFGYPMFALLFLPGRFRAPAPRRPGRALAAFFFIASFPLAGVIVGAEGLETWRAKADAGDTTAKFVAIVPVFFVILSLFYLWIGATLALVRAETGSAARSSRKLRTFIQFFYLPFFVYFLHRRIRRLVRDFEHGDPIVVNLPLEALKIERQADGHLSLLLTERIGCEDYERYAEEFLSRLDSGIGDKGYAAGMHIWNLKIDTIPLRLVCEGYPNRICLESDSHAGDMLLKQLQQRLALESGMPVEASTPTT